MTAVHIIAIDLAKRSFQVCATDRGGACVDAPGLARRFLTAFGSEEFYRSCVKPLDVA